MAAGVLLSGCTKNELSPVSPSELGVVGSEYVSFLPVSGLASTKATTGPADSTYYPTDWTFGTYAVYTDDYTKDGVYINNKEVHFTGTSNANNKPDVANNGLNVWRTDEAYVWPKSRTLDFYSYSPYDSLNTRVQFNKESCKAITIDNFRVYNHPQAAEDKVAGQFDVMVADPALGQNKNDSNTQYYQDKENGVSGPNTGSGWTYSGVPTVFRHKLAYIDSVQVNTDTNYLAQNVGETRYDGKKVNMSADANVTVLNTVPTLKEITGDSDSGSTPIYSADNGNTITVYGALVDSAKAANNYTATYLCLQPKITGIVFDSIYIRGSYKYASPTPAYSEWTPTLYTDTDQNDSTVWYMDYRGGTAIGYKDPGANTGKTPKAGKFRGWTTIPGPNYASSTENGYLFVLPQTLGKGNETSVKSKQTARLKVYYSVTGYYVFLTGKIDNSNFSVSKVQIEKFNDDATNGNNCRTITLNKQTAGNIAEGKTDSNPASWDVNKKISYYLTFGYKGDGAFDIIYWAPNVAPWEEEGWTATVSVNDK